MHELLFPRSTTLVQLKQENMEPDISNTIKNLSRSFTLNCQTRRFYTTSHGAAVVRSAKISRQYDPSETKLRLIFQQQFINLQQNTLLKRSFFSRIFARMFLIAIYIAQTFPSIRFQPRPFPLQQLLQPPSLLTCVLDS